MVFRQPCKRAEEQARLPTIEMICCFATSVWSHLATECHGSNKWISAGDKFPHPPEPERLRLDWRNYPQQFAQPFFHIQVRNTRI